jgi:hypothetical protein
MRANDNEIRPPTPSRFDDGLRRDLAIQHDAARSDASRSSRADEALQVPFSVALSQRPQFATNFRGQPRCDRKVENMRDNQLASLHLRNIERHPKCRLGSRREIGWVKDAAEASRHERHCGAAGGECQPQNLTMAGAILATGAPPFASLSAELSSLGKRRGARDWPHAHAPDNHVDAPAAPRRPARVGLAKVPGAQVGEVQVLVRSPVLQLRHANHDVAQRLSYSSWRRHQTPVSLRPLGARSSHWYMPQRPSSPRA